SVLATYTLDIHYNLPIISTLFFRIPTSLENVSTMIWFPITSPAISTHFLLKSTNFSGVPTNFKVLSTIKCAINTFAGDIDKSLRDIYTLFQNTYNFRERIDNDLVFDNFACNIDTFPVEINKLFGSTYKFQSLIYNQMCYQHIRGRYRQIFA